MPAEKRFTKATWKIMERLLETDRMEDALARSLEIIVETLNSEEGNIWLLDGETDRLSPVYHIGTGDISNITIGSGSGIEGEVVKTGRPVMIGDAAGDDRIDGSIYGDGFSVRNMICVPLDNLHEVVGCIQVMNKKDGGTYDSEELELCEHMASLAAITMEEKGLSFDRGEKKEVLVTLRNVTKEFESSGDVLQVLKGISLDIYKNEFVVILGESGCGKTTMMNIIGGMDSLTSGTLLVEGRDLSHPSDDELTRYRRSTVGFIFQAYNLMPNLTALENVQFIAELVDDPMDPEEAIEKVRLGKQKNNYPGQMSGGQQQRVSIARAIRELYRAARCHEPGVLRIGVRERSTAEHDIRQTQRNG